MKTLILLLLLCAALSAAEEIDPSTESGADVIKSEQLFLPTQLSGIWVMDWKQKPGEEGASIKKVPCIKANTASMQFVTGAKEKYLVKKVQLCEISEETKKLGFIGDKATIHLEENLFIWTLTYHKDGWYLAVIQEADTYKETLRFIFTVDQ